MRWVVGDVHGCLVTLQTLLGRIHLKNGDSIYFLGDLINRGLESKRTLEFLYSYQPGKFIMGNHDIALLAAAGGVISYEHNSCFKDILTDPRKDLWLNWLKKRPFIINDGAVMVHAGLHPLWTLEQHSHVAERLNLWLSNLSDFSEIKEVWDRSYYVLHPDEVKNTIDELAFGLNVFTRMRFLNEHGSLMVDIKKASQADLRNIPWFNAFEIKPLDRPIIFGHWAELKGKLDSPHIIGLDTGCVWGGQLTAYNIDTKTVIQQDCLDRSSAWQEE